MRADMFDAPAQDAQHRQSARQLIGPTAGKAQQLTLFGRADAAAYRAFHVADTGRAQAQTHLDLAG